MRGNGRADNRTNEEGREYNRRIEDERPNDLGRINEQYQDDSRTDSDERNSIQLDIFSYSHQTIPEKEIHETNKIIDLPEKEKINYKITSEELGVGTLSEKYKRNIEAIKVLKKCEAENRLATVEEQISI